MLRWLGPHKGVVHLALASITNAYFDLWAKSRGVPLWRLLLDLKPEQLVALLDLSYLDEQLDEGRREGHDYVRRKSAVDDAGGARNVRGAVKVEAALDRGADASR
jgi:L-alanine-DL-glutamate epimerase-like enolase superfamily enzyme